MSGTVTYPCVVGHRIVELTEEQAEAAGKRLMTDRELMHELVGDLLQRIESLEYSLRCQGIKVFRSPRPGESR